MVGHMVILTYCLVGMVGRMVQILWYWPELAKQVMLGIHDYGKDHAKKEKANKTQFSSKHHKKAAA